MAHQPVVHRSYSHNFGKLLRTEDWIKNPAQYYVKKFVDFVLQIAETNRKVPVPFPVNWDSVVSDMSLEVLMVHIVRAYRKADCVDVYTHLLPLESAIGVMIYIKKKREVGHFLRIEVKFGCEGLRTILTNVGQEVPKE